MKNMYIERSLLKKGALRHLVFVQTLYKSLMRTVLFERERYRKSLNMQINTYDGKNKLLSSASKAFRLMSQMNKV